MFPRILKQNKKDKVYEYLVISRSVRKSGRSTTDNIANLGNLKNLSRYDIEHLIDGLIKIFQIEKYILGGEVEILESLVYGPIIVWQHLWQQLKLSDLIGGLLKKKHPTLSISVSKYVELMTVNRCIEPLSKLGITRWFETTCYKEMQGYSDLAQEVNYFYRSMDYLVEIKNELEQAIFNRLRNLFSVNVKLTFYDITSTFFYGDQCPLAEPGYSRDHRPDCDQVVVGVVTSFEGLPLKHYVFTGGTADSTTVEKVIGDLRQSYCIEETVFVGDRGMITKLNLGQLEDHGFGYIMGVKLRQDALCQMLFAQGKINWDDLDEIDELNKLKVLAHTVAVKDFLVWKIDRILTQNQITASDDGWQCFCDYIAVLTNADEPATSDFKWVLQELSPEMTDKVRYKIGAIIKRYHKRYEKAYRFVFCLNAERRVSARIKRAKRLTELAKQLDDIFSDEAKKRAKAKAEIDKAIKKMFAGYKSKFKKFFEFDHDPVDNQIVGYRQNRAAIEAVEPYDGVFALLASQHDLSVTKVVTSYKNLKEVETLFDDFKNFVDVRPFRHRLETRVRGHVFICILALLLKRVYEVNCLGSKSVTEPLEEFDKVKLVRYKVKFSTREERQQIIPKVTNINPLQKKYFNQVGIKNPMNIEKFMW